MEKKSWGFTIIQINVEIILFLIEHCAIGVNRSMLTQIDYHFFSSPSSLHNTNPNELYEIVTGLWVESERNMLRKTNGIFRLKKESFIMRALSEIYIRIVTQTTHCCSLCRLLSPENFPRALAERIINHSSLFFTFPFRWKISKTLFNAFCT